MRLRIDYTLNCPPYMLVKYITGYREHAGYHRGSVSCMMFQCFLLCYHGNSQDYDAFKSGYSMGELSIFFSICN